MATAEKPCYRPVTDRAGGQSHQTSRNENFVGRALQPFARAKRGPPGGGVRKRHGPRVLLRPRHGAACVHSDAAPDDAGEPCRAASHVETMRAASRPPSRFDNWLIKTYVRSLRMGYESTTDDPDRRLLPRLHRSKQGKSGLGLEAQRQAVVDYLNGGTWELVAEFTEIKYGQEKRPARTGQGTRRSEAQQGHAGDCQARPSRSQRPLHFRLMETKVKFVAAICPRQRRSCSTSTRRWPSRRHGRFQRAPRRAWRLPRRAA